MDLLNKLAEGGDTGFLGQLFTKKSPRLPGENQKLDPNPMPVASPRGKPAKKSDQKDYNGEISEEANPYWWTSKNNYLDLTRPLNDYFNEVTNANRDLLGFRGMNDELAELKLRLMLDTVQSDEEVQMLTSYNNKRLHNYWYDDLKQAKRLSDLHRNSVKN
jgi:hypothetical protein